MKGKALKKIYSAIHDDVVVGMLSLLVLTLVDLIAITIFQLSIAVDVLTACQLVALGVVAVLFKVRARSRRQNGAWLFWASITFFGGLMFTLNTIIIQGDDQKPQYVIRAEADYNSASESLDDLLAEQSEYRKQNRRSVALEMEPAIQDARAALEELREGLSSAEARWKSEPVKEIRAIDIFARIPYVFQNPSPSLFIAAIYFIVLYASVELSIFSIAGEIGGVDKKTKEIKPPRRSAKKKEDPLQLRFLDDRFEDLSREDYRRAAELPDGSVKLPEDVARALRISRDEAEKLHSDLFAGYIYRDGRYVKIGTT